VTYWVLSLALLSFGVIAMFSVGRPFAMIGLTLLALGPVRKRPMLFWPPLAAVVAWNLGYLAIAPYSCTATQTIGVGAAPGDEGTTLCSSLVGITYSGRGVYNPSLEPANQVGLLLAALTFVVVLAAVRWRGRHGRVEPSM
jgi:hypothetical protein